MVGARERDLWLSRYAALILLCHKCGIMNPPNSFCEGR